MKRRFISASLSLFISLSLFMPIYANEPSRQVGDITSGQLKKEAIKTKKEMVKLPRDINEAVGNYIKSENDFRSVLAENLEEDNYGGIYVKDDILYIKTTIKNDTEKIQQKIENIEKYIDSDIKEDLNIILLEDKTFESNTTMNDGDTVRNKNDGRYINIKTNEEVNKDLEVLKRTNSVIIIEKNAKYTMEEFETAIEQLWNAKKNGEISLIGTGVYEEKNCLLVEAKEWSEESKSKIIEISGIERNNIVFEEVDGIFEDQRASLTDAIPGSRFESENGNISSVGCGVYYEIEGIADNEDGYYGFITAAHGLDEGEDMYVYGYSAGYVDFTNIGPVNENTYAYGDVAVIYRGTDPTDDSYEATFTLNTSDGKIILNTGRAIEGDEVVMFGQSSTKETGTVLNASYTVDWDGEGSGTYKYMIKTDINSKSGDSGGPLLRLSSNGSYTLLGILKGREDGEKAIFTSWKGIEGYLEYDSSGRAVDVWLWP